MKHMIPDIQFIAFDADDTLWENESNFQEFEAQFSDVLSMHASKEQLSHELYCTEMKNLHLYGYGAKGMMLSMIEVICRITKGKTDLHCIDAIIKLGQELLQRPVKLLPNVEEVIQILSAKYQLVLATKGDLLEQKRKISDSGLSKYFYHIEIMDNKNLAGYQNMFNTLNCSAKDIVMIGNSIKSDILPVLELGGHAIHIPFHTTWLHEQYSESVVHDKYIQLDNIKQILNYLLPNNLKAAGAL